MAQAPSPLDSLLERLALVVRHHEVELPVGGLVDLVLMWKLEVPFRIRQGRLPGAVALFILDAGVDHRRLRGGRHENTADLAPLLRDRFTDGQQKNGQDHAADDDSRSEVLYPPPPPRPYRCDGYGDYLFVASRLSPLKRVGLVLEALAHPAAGGIRCMIAGDGEEHETLRSRINTLGLGERVRLVGSVPDTELVEHLARCRAVCYPPSAEDYGLVTLEAFVSRKAVITCVDSGGPAELVRPDQDGLVVEPDPASLANAFRRVMDDDVLAERLGAAAEARARDFTWERTIPRLLVG